MGFGGACTQQIAALEAQISSLSPRGQSGQSAASAAELEEVFFSPAFVVVCWFGAPVSLCGT